MKHPRSLFIIAALVCVAAFVPNALAGAPTGMGPNDPLAVDENWLPVGANSQLWFYFDYPGDRSTVKVILDGNGNPNITLLILTPDQAFAYAADPTVKPVGLGTPPGAASQASHDLVWQGAFNFPGRFFAVVENKGSSNSPFRLLISGESITTRPTPAPTVAPVPVNPFATPIPTGNIQGRLVFQEASGGIIYSVNGDGSQLQSITYGMDPSWSPDGKRIAFSRWNQPAGLFISDASGSNEHLVFASEQLISPQWSPDGKRVVFARQRGGSVEETTFCFGRSCFSFPPNPYWKVGIVDLDSGALNEPACSTHCFSPTWNSDNRTVAYADAQVGIMATDTTTSNPAWTLFGQNPAVQAAAYSPDGTRIAFQVKQHDHWEVNVMDADGSNLKAMTFADPLSFKAVNNVAPAWSPNGKQLLFLSDRNGKWEFFTAQLDGSGITQVLKNVTDAIPVRYNFSNERVIDWMP